MITFKLHYHTDLGQSVFITGNHLALGKNDPENAVKMTYSSGDIWTLNLDIAEGESLSYQYLIKEGSKVIATEKSMRTIASTKNTVEALDEWNDKATFDHVFDTSVFDPILKRTVSKTKLAKKFTHEFSIYVPLFEQNQTIAILGNSDFLGAWDLDEVLPMVETSPNFYKLRVDLTQARKHIEYKYAIVDKETNKVIFLEEGDNRSFFNNRGQHNVFVQDALFRRPPSMLWRGTGVAIPIFSLRSEESVGVGEFSDLPHLANWASEIGLRILQILPINDTSAQLSWVDSYPYSAISVFALHPIYLNVSSLGYDLTQDEQEQIKTQRAFLNSLPTVDYEKVMALKSGIIDSLFERNLKQIKADKKFKTWIKENQDWLHDYATFSILRDLHGHCTFKHWGEASEYSKDIVTFYTGSKSKTYTTFLKIAFVQYHLHLQLSAAVDNLHEKGLSLKGDIPIGINRDSVEAWVEPELYHMHMQAGAPPDGFSDKGQNWGFPTYNWERMREDNYKWWTNRFVKLSQYFDSFRIDHILGFFRIWQIPVGSTQGVLGYFNPALPYSLQDLRKEGINLSIDRLTKPYLPKAEVSDLFNHNAGILNWLFNEHENTYSIKDIFSTQQKVEYYFFDLENNAYHVEIKNKLLNLLANVLFIEDVDTPGYLHPRFGIEKTSSFKGLNPWEQDIILRLQLDYFYNRHEAFWYEKGKEKLPIIKSATDMLICGEDLGLVPTSVPVLLKELGILTLEIQRMPKKIGTPFLQEADIPYLSVITPSTHDMSTLRQWWEDNPALTQTYFNEVMGNHGPAPAALTASLAQDILFNHLKSPSVLSIFQIQDLFAMDRALWAGKPVDERINIPENIPHYWRYRMPITLEALQENESFNTKLKNLIRFSGRG